MNQMSGAAVSLSLKQLSPVVARRRPRASDSRVPAPCSRSPPVSTTPCPTPIVCKAGTSKSWKPHKLPSQQNGKCRPQKFFPQNLGQLKPAGAELGALHGAGPGAEAGGGAGAGAETEAEAELKLKLRLRRLQAKLPRGKVII